MAWQTVSIVHEGSLIVHEGDSVIDGGVSAAFETSQVSETCEVCATFGGQLTWAASFSLEAWDKRHLLVTISFPLFLVPSVIRSRASLR